MLVAAHREYSQNVEINKRNTADDFIFLFERLHKENIELVRFQLKSTANTLFINYKRYYRYSYEKIPF